MDLEVLDSASTVGPSVVKLFPFLNGCTALRLPASFSADPKKARLYPQGSDVTHRSKYVFSVVVVKVLNKS